MRAPGGIFKRKKFFTRQVLAFLNDTAKARIGKPNLVVNATLTAKFKFDLGAFHNRMIISNCGQTVRIVFDVRLVADPDMG